MTPIDIPFEYRHTCWFCAEPCNKVFSLRVAPGCHHPSLTIPACGECKSIANKAPTTSVWECRDYVKDALVKRYASHLAIGDNWTKEELEASEFSCKILSGFRESGWMMYEIARDRVNFRGWPISIDGVVVDEQWNNHFHFNGLTFSHLGKAITYYRELYGLDRDFMTSLINTLGQNRFGYALRLAKLYRSSSAREKQRLLRELQDEQA